MLSQRNFGKILFRLLHEKIITDKLKIRSIQLEDVITSIERFHPGAAMEFAMGELQRDPYDFNLNSTCNIYLLFQLFPTATAQNEGHYQCSVHH